MVARLSSQAIQTGELFGLPPTNKVFQTSGIHIVRFVDGKMAEHWANNDDLGMLRQLGAIPG